MATDILNTRIQGGDRGVTTADAVGDPHGAMGGAGMQAPTFMADGATPPMPGLARPGQILIPGTTAPDLAQHFRTLSAEP